jgi:ABC-type phosphate/phosphonate transport system substrate-binding protein
MTRRGFIAAVAAACGACRTRQAQPGRDRPLVIVFGPLHAPRSAAALRTRWAQASRLELELRVESSETAINLIQAGRADGALLSLFDYLFCAKVFGVVPLAQVVRAGGRTVQAGEIIVGEGAPLRELRELRGQRVGFVDRTSVTGFLLPAAQLMEDGIAVEPTWLGSHEAVLAAVREGRVAAGATYAGHAGADDGVRVLASTRTIANEPLFARAEVHLEAREALRDALLGEHEPGALAGVADATGFQSPAQGTYEAALAMVRAAGQRVEDMVPGGWARANEHRRPLWSFGP